MSEDFLGDFCAQNGHEFASQLEEKNSLHDQALKSHIALFVHVNFFGYNFGLIFTREHVELRGLETTSLFMFLFLDTAFTLSHT